MFLRSRRGPLVRLIMFAAALGLFVAAYYWGNRFQYANREPPVIAGVLVRPPMALPEFALRDTVGAPFTREELAGRWTLLAFGDLAQARGHLAVSRMIGVFNHLYDEPDLQSRLQLALALPGEGSELARDFSRLSRALRVLSGEVGTLAEALGEDATTGAPESGEGASLYLLGPGGRLVALFPADQGSESIAADVEALAARPDLFEADSDG